MRRDMALKPDWQAQSSTKLHIVRAQFVGCLPEYYAVYIYWLEALRAIRAYAQDAEMECTVEGVRYDDRETTLYVVRDMVTLGEIMSPDEYKGLTIEQVVEQLTNQF